ncbi:hypothetical protein [Nocardia brevicatena]|uniref:hypothetical protein n=1 Tax=Nocardia brevicatena TaxID=37327 RepID=UPI0002ED4BEE|nr:hypothetical protein [Nocardia brevicatena]
MAEFFSADLEQLRRQASQFDHIGEDVAGIARNLEAESAAAGMPWGADDAGKAFADTYLPEQELTLSELGSLAQVIRQSGSDLKQFVDNVADADRAAGQQITSIDNGIPQNFTVPPIQAVLDNRPHAGETSMPFASSPEYSGVPALPTISGSDQVSEAAPVEVSPHPPTIDAPETGGTPGEAKRAPAENASPADQQQGRPDRNSSDIQPPGSVGESVSAPDTAPVQPPGTGRAAASVQHTSAEARPIAQSTAALNRTPHPWSRRQSAPGPTARPARVSVADPGTSGAGPRPPVRPAARPEPRPVKAAKAARPENKPIERKVDTPRETTVARLARELAERHGVRAFGFETGGVPGETLAEIVAAVDAVLPRHRQIDLRAIGIGELPDGELTRLEWETEPIPGHASDEEGQQPTMPAARYLFTARIVLAERAATDPEYLERAIAESERAGRLARRSALRPVFSSIVRELGTALEVAGGFRAQRFAHRALLLDYLPLRRPSEHSTRATIDGFLQWRAQLQGRSFRHGRFDPSAALSEAFTEVVLNTTRITQPARTLHRLLVRAAEANERAVTRPSVRLPPPVVR